LCRQCAAQTNAFIVVFIVAFNVAFIVAATQFIILRLRACEPLSTVLSIDNASIQAYLARAYSLLSGARAPASLCRTSRTFHGQADSLLERKTHMPAASQEITRDTQGTSSTLPNQTSSQSDALVRALDI
jgi:hypothetical protein